jgi:hypothetical protein
MMKILAFLAGMTTLVLGVLIGFIFTNKARLESTVRTGTTNNTPVAPI